MKKISVKEARDLLFSSDAKYVSQEQSSIYYDNFSGEIAVDAYTTHGCLVTKSGADWHIHAITAESDVTCAIEKVKGMLNLDSEKLMVLTWNRVPEELACNRGAYKFARSFLPYTDQCIRHLTPDDSEQIRNCCSLDSDDDQIAKNMAHEFLSYHNEFLNDPNVTNLGFFENDNLVGFGQAFEQKGLDLSTVNIFVAKPHRKKGYAKRLLSAICATSQNVMYCYSCAKTNIASINTAKSCGFEFKGAYLFI